MKYVPEGTEIVLWGVGAIGRRVISGVYGNHKISFAVDSKVDAGTIYKIGDVTVYPPSVLDDTSFLKNRLIVISIACWSEIAAELEKKGKHIFRDYVPYTCLKQGIVDIGLLNFCANDEERLALLKELSSGKKLCGLYGCCHMVAYETLLLENEQFVEEYCTILLDAHNAGSPRFEMLCKPWIYSTLDLLILSYVYPPNQNESPDWRTVKSWTSEKCKLIFVTNAAFKGYFPQEIRTFPELAGIIKRGDKNINKMIQAGETAERIYQTISMPSFYGVDEINRFFEKELKRLERVESACDVRIGDYMRKYGREKILMYFSTHPRECVMKEIAIRILKAIGINAGMPASDTALYFLREEFVYPSVYHALGIIESPEDEKIAIYCDPRNLVTLSEFVDLYVKINKPYLSGTK